MIIGIYKIENLINHKCYIGQSIDIHRRWTDHKRVYKLETEASYDYPIYRAFRKYGLENFSFEILEECLSSELNEKEKLYIRKYDSFFNGYNQSFGGDSKCEKPKENILKVFNLLQNTTLTHPEIAKECNVSRSLVQGMNVGRVWHNDDFDYPLQKGANTSKLQKKEVKKATTKKKPIKTKNIICPICGNKKMHESKTCKNCAKELSINKNKPSKEELLALLSETTNFELIARKYNVSSATIRKWCKKYEIPFRTSDYKKTIKKEKSTKIQYSIDMIDIDTNQILKTFNSALEAGRYINKTAAHRHILEVCREKRKTAYGYRWKFNN